MAEEIFELIVTTESPDNFRQWFLGQFQQEHKMSCTIEEFAVYFLNFVRNQTDEYNKNSTTSCDRIERSTTKPSTSTANHSMRHQSLNDSRSFGDNSSTCMDTSIGMRSSYDKSRDKRSSPNVSSICLGDFLTPNASKKQSQKARKSMNSTERSSPTNVTTFTAHENEFPNLTTSKEKTNRTSASTPSSMPSSPSLSSLSMLSLSTSQPSEMITTSTPKSTNILKPKKRVATRHTSISNNQFNCSAVRNDNNTVESPHVKPQKDLIRQVFQEERMPDLSQITDRPMLTKFIEIYSILLDLNLVTNILTELSYLVHLINLNVNEYYERNPNMLNYSTITDAMAIEKIHVAASVLKNINNCIYFGLGVLQLQKNILCMLDVTSIKVLLENERLTTLNSSIKNDLMAVYAHKMQLNSALSVSKSNMKVLYQQEQDTKVYFPSSRESAAFKKQRDQFYRILASWESKPFNMEWNFETKLGPHIRSMLNDMNHPINMAHMAKLFTAQLILSCNLTDAIQSNSLPNTDPGKLNKFCQRFVVPSHFYQFPGNQEFFKDFIIAAKDQTNFIEQLKIILTNELIDMNDSTYETLKLSTIDGNSDQCEYIVKPETLTTLSVLAKFLGFIVAQPFIYEFGRNRIVDNRQIELRNKIQTIIDIKEILKMSIKNRKLIVTLPWMVQFISMLDPVSLRTNYYRDVFHIFYGLYTMTTERQTNSLQSMRQTSIFIIRLCLGWLFDQSHVPNEYYSYRQNPQQFKAIEQLCDSELNDEQQIVIEGMNSRPTPFTAIAFDPLLEAILPAACPFLADFRVSIMQQRNSLTGQYKKYTIQNSQQSYKEEQVQNQLIDAFLHAQSNSIKCTVATVQERIYLNIVKDFQVEVLMPFKKDIVESIDKIQLNDPKAIFNELYKIYSNGEKELIEKLQHFVMPETLNRIKCVFDKLLPHEMVDACKLTFINIAVQKALTSIDEWRSKHLNGIEIFTKDIHADVDKVLKNTRANQPKMENKFVIDLTKTPPWKGFDTIQYKLHQLSMYPEQIQDTDEVIAFCAKIRQCTTEHVLPDQMYKTVGEFTVHFMLLLISNRHDLATEQVINVFISLWQCKQFAMFVRPPSTAAQTSTIDSETIFAATDSDISQSNLVAAQTKNMKLIDKNYMFSMILSPLNVFAMQQKSSAGAGKLAQLITKLIKARLMSLSFVNDQYMKLMCMKWEQNTRKSIARIIQAVIDDWRNTNSSVQIGDDSDASLLETLTNLISNIEDIPFET